MGFAQFIKDCFNFSISQPWYLVLLNKKADKRQFNYPAENIKDDQLLGSEMKQASGFKW